MDPNSCLRELSIALSESNWEVAFEHRDTLREWLDRGGFEPNWDVYLEAAEWFSQGELCRDMDTHINYLRKGMAPVVKRLN